jgi:1-acyl-sn-glycerol-3-phosphate acyltransferase
MNADRKQIARDAEAAVRRMTARALRSPAAQPSGTEGTAPSAVPAFDQT